MKRVVLLCHPRSGSSHVTNEINNYYMGSRSIVSEIPMIADKAAKLSGQSYYDLRCNSDIQLSFDDFKQLSYTKRDTLVFNEINRILSGCNNVILKIFNIYLDRQWDIDKLRNFRERYEVEYVRLYRQNLLNAFVSELLAFKTDVWCSNKPIADRILDLSSTMHDPRIDFFFKNIEMINDKRITSLISKTITYEDDVEKTSSFFKKITGVTYDLALNSEKSSLCKQTSNEYKNEILRHNIWITSLLEQKCKEYQIPIEKDFLIHYG